MLVHRVMTWLFVIPLVLAGCGDKGSKPPGGGQSTAPAPPAPVTEEDLPGVDTRALSATVRQQFFRVADRAPSPCGKPHSLRVSLKTDPGCVRARVAARRVLGAARGGNASDDDILAQYDARYGQPVRTFDLAKAPCKGPADAPVTVVEIFDFGCGHCRELAHFGPELLAAYPGKVRVCYLPFNLGVFQLSAEAAAAAMAAHAQGKFPEMMALLFANQGKFSPALFTQLAGELGLDAARFAADTEAARPTVAAFQQQGTEAKIPGTPAFFTNGRINIDDKLDTLKDQVDEELILAR
jgi:protein-disulfide isomerase